MAGGLVGLLDDIAALAKLAAASIDDVGAAAGKASAKAVGVVVDDTAVTPAYVQGLAAERELPIIGKIARGSIRNKLLIILPVALLLSAIAPTLVEIILMIGGTYLSYEGAHKIIHAVTHSSDTSGGHGGQATHDQVGIAAIEGKAAEDATVSSAVRTDLILSAEIMVIALKEVLDTPLWERAIILVVVALLITLLVYGVVALIVKMDDIGLALAQRESAFSKRIGTAMVRFMPKLLSVLSKVGTVAMLWVGGHILLSGSYELGWHWPYGVVHHWEDSVHGVSGIGGALGWIVNTAASTVVGLAVGAAVATVVAKLPKRPDRPHAASEQSPA